MIMSAETFDIVFRGDIAFGQNLVDVKSRLQQLFKIDSAKVDALFTGKPIVLKRALDAASAEKYRDVLTKAGALIEIAPTKPAEVQSTPVPTKPAAVPENPTPTNTGNSDAPGQWTLAPVGSLLMPTSARLAPINRHFDLSVFSLRAVGGNLLDKTEVPAVAAAVVSIPEYKVADVGANLIEAGEKNELPLLEIDVEDWGLSEPGAPLLADNERKVEVASPVLNNDFSLAPVGSLLEQIKPKVDIKIPDVSGLKLVE
jgi:hypothetical protein